MSDDKIIAIHDMAYPNKIILIKIENGNYIADPVWEELDEVLNQLYLYETITDILDSVTRILDSYHEMYEVIKPDMVLSIF